MLETQGSDGSMSEKGFLSLVRRRNLQPGYSAAVQRSRGLRRCEESYTTDIGV